MIKIFATGMALALLTGCGTSIKFTGTKVTEDPISGKTSTEYAPGELAAKDANTAMQACYRMVKEAEVAESKALAQIDPQTLPLLLMSRSNEKALLAMAGKLPDPWKPATSVYDVAIAEVQQKNESVRAVLPTAIGVVGGAYTIAKVADAVTSITNNAGPKTATTIQGDGNQAEVKNERTSIDNKVTSTASGDGVANTTSNPHNASSPATQGGGTPTGTSPADSAFEQCKGAGTGTMGNVAGCMAMAGQDVKIEHGQMYVGGSLYGPGNTYGGYTPVVE